MPRFRFHLGISLPEAGLIGGLLSLGALTVLTVIDIQPPGMPKEAVTPTGLPGSVMTVKLANGKQLQLHDYPIDLRKSVWDNGAGETTSALANTLSQMAQQLQQQREIKKAQAGHLYAIAHQVRRIAEIEQVTQTLVENSPEKTWRRKAISFDGKTEATLIAFVKRLGVSESTPEGELTRLHQLVSQAEKAKALDNPEVRSLVEVVVRQVSLVATGVETATSEIYYHPQKMARYRHLINAGIQTGASGPLTLQDLPTVTIN